MDDVARLLDEYVPRVSANGDWPAVLRDADTVERGPRRRRLALVAVPAVVAGILIAILAWPSTTTTPSFLERARAALGTGPVVHFVEESERGHVIVNLETGERRPVPWIQEVWYDPAGGLHLAERFEGIDQSDVVVPSSNLRKPDALRFRELATGYTDALATGKARIVERAVIDGEPVRWIEVGTHTTTSNDPTLYSDDVAVSERTYEPVAFRVRLKDETIRTSTVRSFETLPAGAGNFTPSDEDGMFSFSGGGGSPLTPAEATEILGQAPLWVGANLGDRSLATMREDRYDWSTDTDGEGEYVTSRSVLLVYSPPGDSTEKHSAFVRLSPEDDFFTKYDMGVTGFLPPPGSILVESGENRAKGLLKQDGLVVTITARDEQQVLDAARALRPYGS